MTTKHDLGMEVLAERWARQDDADAFAGVLQSIREWCYPAAEEMPNDPQARCEWYARRLLLIANAARAAIAKAQQD